MKRLALILLFVLPLLVNCRREPFNPQGIAPQPSEMGIYIAAPGSASTRADVGEEAAASADEYELHDLKVWVFKSVGHESVATLSLSGSQLPVSGQTRRYSVRVSREFARERPDVDVFVIGNSASIGCTLTESSTWEQINEATFP